MMLATVQSAIVPVVSVILSGGFITALLAVYKARPERDSVVVTTTQNAATILKGLNEALYADLNRARRERDEAERRADLYEDAMRSAGMRIPIQPSAPQSDGAA